jgi:DNA-directed RNA polymerase specialized sigma24 family protein
MAKSWLAAELLPPDKLRLLLFEIDQALALSSIRQEDRGGLREALTEAVGKLSPRHRKVLELYYTTTMTLPEVGQKLGDVSGARIYDIRRSIFGKLRRAALQWSRRQAQGNQGLHPRSESPTLKTHQSLAPIFSEIDPQTLLKAGFDQGEISVLRLRIVEGREFNRIADASGIEEREARKRVDLAVLKLRDYAREAGLLPPLQHMRYSITGPGRDHEILARFFVHTGDAALLQARFAPEQIDDLRQLLLDGKPWWEIEAEHAKDANNTRQSIRHSVRQLQAYACRHRGVLEQITSGLAAEKGTARMRRMRQAGVEN